MTIPKLKRVKVSSERELKNWLAAQGAPSAPVMIVTCSKKSPKKHVSSAQVRAALAEKGWQVSGSYTLDGDLLGHVVSAA